MTKRIFIFFLILSSLFSIIAKAESISDIFIEGNSRVETESILSNIDFHRNSNLDEKTINSSIKRLYSTNLFENVSIAVKGSVVTVYVKENPLVSEIVFQGNTYISSKTLKQEISLKMHSFLSEDMILRDINRIKAIYKQSGRLRSSVSVNTDRTSDNTARVIFKINEGPKTRIKKIFFSGNENFDRNTLKGVLRTREKSWRRILSDSFSTYSDDLLAYDQELLRMFYMSQGYLDFTIISVVAEIDNDSSSLASVVFDLYEGNKYYISDISVKNNSKELENNNFRQMIDIEKGDVFNQKIIDESISNISNWLNNNGYFAADVDVEYQNVEENSKDDKPHVSLVFLISPGDKYKVNHINIAGNHKTRDSMIRRRIKVIEGDTYSRNDIVKSRLNIIKSGAFKNVDLRTRNIGDNKIDADILVQEAQTSMVNVGAGYDSNNGLVGTISVTERNFRGLGQQLTIMVNRTKKNNSAEFSLQEPMLTDSGFAGGFSVGYDRQNINGEDLYKKSSNHTSGGLSKSFGSFQLNYGLGYYVDNIFDLKPGVSSYIQEQKGKKDKILAHYGLSYGSLNNPMYPTYGQLASVTQSMAIPPGDSRYIKNELEFLFFRPLPKKAIFQSKISIGSIKSYGKSKSLSIVDRFFLGVNDVRGFDVKGLGPRELDKYNEALGGKKYTIAKIQIEKSIPFFEELDFKGSIFSDWALSYDLDTYGPNIVKGGGVRLSCGAGISWVTPIGPMRLDYGVPLLKERFDQTKRVRFTVGWGF